MRADIENLVTSVEKSLELLRQRMDWDTVSHRLEEFDARVENPNLWDNPEEAQKLMRERQTLLDAMEGSRWEAISTFILKRMYNSLIP